MKSFDDRKLQNLVRFHFFATNSEDEKIQSLMEKDGALTNDERNSLLTFLEQNRYQKPLSIRDMKNEIFAIIGNPPNGGSSYSTVVNRSELEHIFNFIKSNQK